MRKGGKREKKRNEGFLTGHPELGERKGKGI